MQKKGRQEDTRGFLLITVMLLAFWLLMSASFDWQHILAGIVLSAGLTHYWREMIFLPGKKTTITWRQIAAFLQYTICLVIEIIKANFHVAYLVLHPRLPISPGFVITSMGLEKELSKTYYLNSITLTPGTITVKCEGDRLIVHCFTEQHAQVVQHWYLYHQIYNMERGVFKWWNKS